MGRAQGCMELGQTGAGLHGKGLVEAWGLHRAMVMGAGHARGCLHAECWSRVFAGEEKR